MKTTLLLAALVALLATPAEARRKSQALASECNVTMPCASGYYTERAKKFINVRFGTPRMRFRGHKPASIASIINHPTGCPPRAFCGCGAAVRVFGTPRRDLWLASNWLRFPRATPAPGMVAARRGHVFVLESHVSGNTWIVYDANSGGRKTRIHPRSLAGYTVVNPRG